MEWAIFPLAALGFIFGLSAYTKVNQLNEKVNKLEEELSEIKGE